jgi:hypothetical protein
LICISKEGLSLGACVVYGYVKDLDNHNRIIVDDYAAEVVRAIFQGIHAALQKMPTVPKNIGK